MRQVDTVTAIETLLQDAVDRLQKRFGDELVSVVLYGSHARGEAGSASDIDLLVVVRHLPPEWKDVFALEDELMRRADSWGKRLDLRLVEAQAVSYSVTWAAPLMLEVYDVHRVIYDPMGFFGAEMKRFAEVARERGIRKIGRGLWRVTSLLDEKAFVFDTLAQDLASRYGVQL